MAGTELPSAGSVSWLEREGGAGMNKKTILQSSEFFLLMVIMVIFVLFGFVNTAFFSLGNLFDIAKSMVETGILAMGCLVVLISGGLDLSFMAVAVFAMHSVSLFFGRHFHEVPLLLLLLCGMLIGAAVGLINSFFIAKLRLPSFIVTLGTSNVISGLCLAFIGSKQYNNIPSSMIDFSRWNIISVENASGGKSNLHGSVIVLLAVVLLTSFLLRKTMLGRKIYCVGGNPVSSSRIGIQNAWILVFVYCFMGAIAGLTGILHVCFQRMSNPYDLVGNELNVIAAVVIGGPRVGGGYGNTTGTILGVLLITMINNSLVMLRIPTFWQKAVVGMIIIIGTAVQILRYRRNQSSKGG